MNNLNFLREEPPLNWLDYCVNEKKFKIFLESKKSDPTQVSTLGSQFTDQAILVDRECDILARTECDKENLAHIRHKSTKLWMYAFSCFASMNWDFALMKQFFFYVFHNILSMRALMNRLVAFCYPGRTVGSVDDVLSILEEIKESDMKFRRPEHFFISWLYATWLLKVDVSGRYPEIIAKPTVSNPANQFDSNLMQSEQFKNCIIELRKSVEGARSFLTRILECCCNDQMVVLTKDCFLEPLIKGSDLKINNFLNFGSLNVIPVQVPNFQASDRWLSPDLWAPLVSFSLMCNHFAAGNLIEARNKLKQIVRNWERYDKGSVNNPMPIFGINVDDLAGYCDAFGIAHSFQPPVSRIHDESIFSEVNEKIMKSIDSFTMLQQSECQRIACTSMAASSDDIFVENVVKQFVNDFSPTLNALIKLINKTSTAHLIKVCWRLIKMKAKITALQEIMQFFSAKIPNFVKDFENVRFSEVVPLFRNCLETFLRFLKKKLLTGDIDLWRLLVSFDMPEIKSLCSKLSTQFSLPRRYEISRMVGDAISAAATQGNVENVNLILGKLEQLAVIGDGARWRTFCNDCVKEMGPLGKIPDIQVRFAYDAVRVQLECWHARLSRVSNNAEFVHFTHTLNLTVKAFVQSSMTNTAAIIVYNLLFTHSFACLRLRSPFLDVAKMIGAYMTSTDSIVARQIIEGPWWHVMSSTFQECQTSSKRRNEGQLIDCKLLVTKSQFLEMIRLIKEYRTISFLISFLGKMFTAAKNELKVMKEIGGLSAGQDIEKDIFIEHPEYWHSFLYFIPILLRKQAGDEPKFDIPFLVECLHIVFENALMINPINAFWLRSYADFHFACDKFFDALVLYMEACVACSESLLKPLPDNVVDDVMWRKVQHCLRFIGNETASALICQFMRTVPERYISTAASLMKTCGDSFDDACGYFTLLSDMNLVEFMSDVYGKLNLHKKEKCLLQAISVPEMNSHNMSQLEKFRRRERFLLVLCAHVFRLNL
ncbi:unnamed protein product [Thelazia callipaeda]|uniref:MYND-type domain-containing protein n=1 Tax=Thelazia callipaeda TaxID=103827 RepID=A0A0N5CMM9_THECL|nr:unnamed protein product [Thelazia callipaeda]